MPSGPKGGTTRTAKPEQSRKDSSMKPVRLVGRLDESCSSVATASRKASVSPLIAIRKTYPQYACTHRAV